VGTATATFPVDTVGVRLAGATVALRPECTGDVGLDITLAPKADALGRLARVRNLALEWLPGLTPGDPPAVPGSFTGQAVCVNGAPVNRITFTLGTDAVSAQVLRGGAVIASPARGTGSVTVDDAGVTGGQAYTYTARAVGADGQLSVATSGANVTARSDCTIIVLPPEDDAFDVPLPQGNLTRTGSTVALAAGPDWWSQCGSDGASTASLIGATLRVVGVDGDVELDADQGAGASPTTAIVVPGTWSDGFIDITVEWTYSGPTSGAKLFFGPGNEVDKAAGTATRSGAYFNTGVVAFPKFALSVLTGTTGDRSATLTRVRVAHRAS
jgi:hypothetical protein